ncbi:MAG TPA: CDGSH iron-sulfur domain-containing protein [Segetibacter sp.]
MEYPKIGKCEPTKMTVVPGKVYPWCTCGLSEKQPLCDGKHKTITEENCVFTNLKVTFEEEKEVWFCNCKQTKNPPFCDGTHNTVEANKIIIGAVGG